MTCPSLSREQIHDLREMAEMTKLMDLAMAENKSKVMTAARLNLAVITQHTYNYSSS